MTKLLNILLVDDEELLLESFGLVIQKGLEGANIHTTNCPSKTLEIIKTQKLDAVLLDVSMPEIDGFELLKEIKKVKPALPVLMLTSFSKKAYATRAYRAGASGFISKLCKGDELIEAIEKVVTGRKHFDIDEIEKQIRILQNTERDSLPHENLTKREFDVMMQIAEGNSLTDIAKRMELSVKTISTFRSRLLKKMNMSRDIELTYYAIKNELIFI